MTHRNVAALFLCGILPTLLTPALAQDYPSEPITVVVHSSAGGGTDTTARTIGDILTKEEIVQQPMIVENHTGGSGAAAIQYMANADGDPYKLWVATSTVAMIQARRTGLPYTYEDFTPIALLAQDPGVIAVRADSPHQTTSDLIEAAKATPNGIKTAFGSIGGSAHIIAGMLAETTGSEFAYVAFQGGGEAVAALLGGHVDFVAENPNELVALVQSGDLRLIGVTADDRLPDYPDVPTLNEQGIELEFETGRFVFGAGNLPEGAEAFWEEALAQLAETEAWKAFIKDNQMVENFVIGEDLDAYLDSRSGPMIETLISLGVIKE